MSFKSVSPQVDFPAQERDRLKHWYDSGIVDRYLKKNSHSQLKFSFLDGPITANNPMGVHHAWGRSYKDLWQRYHTFKGYAGRYQNGFDCQGLWVEVEVEKELGFKTKKDIETYGVANFINKCKDRVLRYSAMQTEQTKRLGNFMDWDNSYFTMSDANNYAIWNFLQVCWQRGWLYKGSDSVPWCPRCETAISQHEMLTEDYKEITHKSVYLKLPIVEKPDESLLVWTTTPWTIPANIAVAVDTQLEYALVDGCWLAKDAVERVMGPGKTISRTVLGQELVGLKYSAPYDYLEAVKNISHHPGFHTVIATDPQIMPITSSDGTGLVHTAVSAGIEDFQLGKKLGLPLVNVIADNADYLPGLGELAGQNAKKHPEIILDKLESENWALKIENYTHRYPACWRCKTELVWKIADEWYIGMDLPDPTHPKKLSLRRQMMAVAKQIRWLPKFGLERELDWLKNMHDWLISKKNRYWGLALPIYECRSCGRFEVIGSQAELESRAVSGWQEFAGHSPHKPWIDAVKIACSGCGTIVSRINDVGNVWLDAGVVPFSTLPEDWFPADFITESFPGQFKNWFYSMIAMSTVLKKTTPFKTVLGYGSLLAEDGRPMHKSWGNSIEFNEGADKIGSDVMRWMYAVQNPFENMLFGYKKADETRRRFHLILWNVYNFFVTYANLDGFSPASAMVKPALLDRWILARLKQTVHSVTASLDAYDAFSSAQALEVFVQDLSTWYVRRSRDRVGPSAVSSADKTACHQTLYTVLTNLCVLLAPVMPFMTDEIYTNLTGADSVHLVDWPKLPRPSQADQQLISHMQTVRKVVEQGLAKRKEAGLKVRQPLSSLTVALPGSGLPSAYFYLIADELNVKSVSQVSASDSGFTVELDLRLTPELEAEGRVRELIRQIQEERKRLGASLDQPISLGLPEIPSDPGLIHQLKSATLARDLSQSDSLVVTLL